MSCRLRKKRTEKTERNGKRRRRPEAKTETKTRDERQENKVKMKLMDRDLRIFKEIVRWRVCLR